MNNDGEEVEIVPDNDTEYYTRRGSGWEFHDALPLNDKYWLLGKASKNSRNSWQIKKMDTDKH